MSASTTSTQVLLLHVSGADWRFIHPLVDAGKMPAFERLVERGAIGNLYSPPPLKPPVSSLCLATGCLPERHGVMDVLTVDGDRARPTLSTDIGVSTFWEHAARADISSAAVGWPATHPTQSGQKDQEGNRLVVSDGFPMSDGTGYESWTFDPLTVSDPSLHDTLSELRIHPNDFDGEMLAPFLNDHQRIDVETDDRLKVLQLILARAMSIHGAATWIAEHWDWQLLTVHFEMLERICAHFIQYRTPRMAHVTETDFAIYQNTVDAAYQFFDTLLARYIELVGEENHILVVSDHGFHIDDMRPNKTPLRGRDRWKAYRSLGVLVAAGPDVQEDALVFGSRQVDVAPTLMTLLRAPLASTFDGKVIQQLFADSHQMAVEPSVVTECQSQGSNPIMPDETYIKRRLHELAAMGDIEKPSANIEAWVEQVRVDAALTLATAHVSRRDLHQGIEVLNDLISLEPDHVEARMMLANAYYQVSDFGACRSMLDDLGESGVEHAAIDYLHGRLAADMGDYSVAQQHFDAALARSPSQVAARQMRENTGQAWLACRQFESAAREFREALKVEPDSASVNGGLGGALLALKEYSAAVDHLQRSLGVLQQQPLVHTRLGYALAALGRRDESAAAFRRALDIVPTFEFARKGLAQVQQQMAAKQLRAQIERDIEAGFDR